MQAQTYPSKFCILSHCLCSTKKQSNYKGKKHCISAEVCVQEDIARAVPLDLVQRILQIHQDFVSLERAAHQRSFQPTLQRLEGKCGSIVLQCVNRPPKEQVEPPRHPSWVYKGYKIEGPSRWFTDQRLYYGAKRHCNGFIFHRATSKSIKSSLLGWCGYHPSDYSNEFQSNKVTFTKQDRFLYKHEMQLKRKLFYLR